MTVHTICDRCGREYVGPGVSVAGQIYCCQGCALGTGCTCGVAGGTTLVTDGDTVVTGGDTVIVDEDAVVVS